jgi:outer membrane lipoprotein
MVKVLLCAFLFVTVIGCAPVLNRDVMDRGVRDFNPAHLIETPEVFKDHLFIFGGIIVETKLVETGSQIEALFVPVDRHGNLAGASPYRGRFIAHYTRSRGLLDPLIFRRGREITIAAYFVEVRKGKIDEMDYVYPVFEIEQAHLWEEIRYDPYYWAPYPYYYPYPYAYPYPYFPGYPLWYDPWWRPYPGPYRPPPP